MKRVPHDEEDFASRLKITNHFADCLTGTLEQARALAFLYLNMASEILVGDRCEELDSIRADVAHRIGEDGLQWEQAFHHACRSRAEDLLDMGSTLLRRVRRAPASDFPCFPTLARGDDKKARERGIANMAVDALFPALADRRLRHREDAFGGHFKLARKAGDFPYKNLFYHTFRRFGELRMDWLHNPQDANRRICVAKDAMYVCKTAVQLTEWMSHEHKSWCDVPPGLAELVNALQTLTVIRALKLLSHLIDRDNIEKEKQEDTDAVIQVAQQVCDMLKEVTITGPARTLPASWRDEHLNICLQIFKSNVSIHDDLSLIHI